jgi:ribosomal protein S18 acetylase RimI-like enzyme
LYALKENDEIVGIRTIGGKPDEQYKKIDWLTQQGKSLYLYRFAVRPQRQKQGVGRMLMDFSENYAVENGYSSIRLDAYSGNPRVLKINEMRGFVRVGALFFPWRELPFFCYEKVIK